ncbi:uncharacterized protein TNCV_2487351 [Trichonephila clavipes]|uniref:Uncharacterized protein n=1 Tax=Trichonephila clavipes TaxID=2585209 RepID=A0A8X6W042_TRICX|nr:uncharacterized protein TNCV_2487351 [Trichonephila clavipes]
MSSKTSASQRWEISLMRSSLYTFQQVHNSQNDRIWCVDVPSISTIIEHRRYSKPAMVWGGICASGKTTLVFVEEGVKTNQKVYQRDITEDVVLPWDQKYFANANWMLQQLSALVCKAITTQVWYKVNFLDVISYEE